MSIVVELPPEEATQLERRADEKGYAVEDYIKTLIARDLLAAQSFDDILAPVRQGFQASGMSEEEANTLFEMAREEAYRDRQASRR